MSTVSSSPRVGTKSPPGSWDWLKQLKQNVNIYKASFTVEFPEFFCVWLSWFVSRKSDWTRNEEIQKKHNFLAIKALVVLQKFFLCRWHCIDSMRFMVPSIWTASNWTGWNTAPNLYRVESELLKVHEGFVEFLLFHKWKCHFVKPWAASSCSFQFFMFCFFFTYFLSQDFLAVLTFDLLDFWQGFCKLLMD